MDIRHYLQSDETLRQRAKRGCVLFLGIVLIGIATPAGAQIEPSTPVTLLQDIVLVLDNSGSRKKNDPRFLAKEAVARFVKGVPDDVRLSLVIFDKQVRATPLGRRDAVDLAPFNYRGPLTNLPAAVQQAIQELKRNGRPGAERWIVLLTDGVVDTGARARDRELTRWLREQLPSDAAGSGIKILTIAVAAGSDNPGCWSSPTKMCAARSKQLLQELAQRTGGRYFWAPQAKDLPGIFAQISHAVFAPAASQAPSKRVPQLAQVSPRTPAVEPAPSNLPQAEPPKAGAKKASTLPGNAPSRKPEPRADTRVTVPLVVPPQAPSGAGAQKDPITYRFVVVAALLMAGILALVAVLLWYRERKPRTKPEAHAPMPMAYLFDLNGVTGRERHELGAVTVIGRVPTAEHNIVINQPAIGRVHAVIERKHHGFWLIDQNSKNGTYVNGHGVTRPTCLTHGDQVHFHEFPFEFALAGMILADATVVTDATLLSNSNAQLTSEAHEEMRRDKRSRFDDTRPRNQTTNPATTAYGPEEPASSEGDGEVVDRDAKARPSSLL
ncbi:MAG: FHA domain-containing protein [Gammaproteobacteria bacterium]